MAEPNTSWMTGPCIKSGVDPFATRDSQPVADKKGQPLSIRVPRSALRVSPIRVLVKPEVNFEKGLVGIYLYYQWLNGGIQDPKVKDDHCLEWAHLQSIQIRVCPCRRLGEFQRTVHVAEAGHFQSRAKLESYCTRDFELVPG